MRLSTEAFKRLGLFSFAINSLRFSDNTKLYDSVKLFYVVG